MMGDETNTRTSPATGSEHDFERTITIGERAIGYLREFRTPAIPRNYELFYIHSAGYNKELSQAIRNAIAAHSRLTEEDAEAIYQTYLQPKEYSEEVEAVGGKVSSEIKEILGWIASASQQTGVYSDSLKGITDELPRVQNQAQLKDVVQKLVLSTNEMADYNHDLEKRLAESKRQIEELHVSLETIRTESLTDQLTGLSNRKRFDQILEIEMAEAEGSGDPLCLMLLDIDHFKTFKDTFGHQTGDQVLRLVAHTMKTNVKGRDLAARYGGEEFAIVLPKTILKAATVVAEQIRSAIRGKELIKKSAGESLGHITVSIGAACYRVGEPLEKLIQRSDACLYAAKHAGRDRVKCETDPDINLDIKAA
jgi:diguanylate cyclase